MWEEILQGCGKPAQSCDVSLQEAATVPALLNLRQPSEIQLMDIQKCRPFIQHRGWFPQTLAVQNSAKLWNQRDGMTGLEGENAVQETRGWKRLGLVKIRLAARSVRAWRLWSTEKMEKIFRSCITNTICRMTSNTTHTHTHRALFIIGFGWLLVHIWNWLHNFTLIINQTATASHLLSK